MSAARSVAVLPGQLWDLLRIQLTNWRWSWPQLVITGALVPIASILALGVFVRRGPAGDASHYVATGSLVLGLLFQNQNLVASNFAFMKANRSLSFFATLPVRRSALVGATWAAFFLLSIPATVVTILFAWQALGVRLAPSPLLVLVLPCCALPMAAIGALIGSLARTFEESSSLVLVATAMMTGLGPVIIPASYLPGPLLYAGFLNPATYAASALRQVLIGPVRPALGLDLLVLIAFTVAMFAVVERTLPWKERRPARPGDSRRVSDGPDGAA